MKGLYTYGQELNEDKRTPNCTLEYHKLGADGVNYGIVKECSKYYIKSAPKGKETIAEAYEYLGGFCNKKNYEYTSYANALKHFKLKLGSINEACDSNVQTENTDDFMSSNVLMTESTDSMKREIARQRQIMYNVSMIMNESTGINPGKTPVMFNGKNPEAETGKSGDEGYSKTDAKPEYEGKKTNGLNKKTAPFKDEPKKSEDQLDECSCSEKEDWGSRGLCKGKDPKKVGWEMEGQQVVSEECDEWDEGLPSSAGVGDANTKKNNTPFTDTVNEEEDSDLDDVEPTDGADDIDFGVEDDMDPNDSEDIENSDEDMIGDEDSIDDENGDIHNDNEDSDDIDFVDSDEDIDLGGDEFGDEDSEFGDDEPHFGDEDDEFGDDEPHFGDEEGEFGDDEPNFGDEDDEFGDDEPHFGDEDDEFGDDEPNFGDEDDEFGDEDDEFGYGNDEDGEDDFNNEDGDIEECGDGCDPNAMLESKRKKMNSIVENVVKKILAEDELHVFGKHPGYRKKPFTLPTTGEDKNQWGEDWNDESVYSEQPFGETIGDGNPFNELVQQITQDVLYQLKTGSAFKKKAK